MTDTEPDQPQTEEAIFDEAVEEEAPIRAELLPEEIAAGSDDPIGQAEAILAESEARTLDPEADIRRTADEATGGDVDPN